MGIKELFSSKDDLDYPNEYLNQRQREYRTRSGRMITLPVLELRVPMCCEKCEEKVKEELEELEGVRDVICDQYNQRVTVTGFVDPLKALRKVKKVKKKSDFFRNSTFISGSSLPIVPAITPGISETRYTANPLMRTGSSGFGRFSHEGRMAPMMQAPPLNAYDRMQAPQLNAYDRRVLEQPVYDDRRARAFMPVDYTGIRRMPSFNNYRHHEAEYISMRDETHPSMTDTHYVPYRNTRPALHRSFSRLPVTNPDYMKHVESEYD